MTWVAHDRSRELASFRQEDPGAKVNALSAYRRSGKLSISITLNQSAYDELHAYLSKHPDFGFAQTNGVFMTPLGNYCSLTVEEATGRHILTRFLIMLESFDASIKFIHGDIQEALNYLTPKQIDEMLYRDLDKEGFFSNLALARRLYREGHRDALHRLAKACFDRNLLREGNTALNFIPENDHLGHYWAANIYRKLAEAKNVSTSTTSS